MANAHRFPMFSCYDDLSNVQLGKRWSPERDESTRYISVLILKGFIDPRCDPWCWNIHQHRNPIFMAPLCFCTSSSTMGNASGDDCNPGCEPHKPNSLSWILLWSTKCRGWVSWCVERSSHLISAGGRTLVFTRWGRSSLIARLVQIPPISSVYGMFMVDMSK